MKKQSISLFEDYMNVTVFTILYDYHTKKIKSSRLNEPTIHKYETVVIDNQEIRLMDIDVIENYQILFDDVVIEAESSIYTLCQIATTSIALEDVLYHVLDKKSYSVGHKIIEYLDNLDSDLTKEEFVNLTDLAIFEKDVFESIIGYLEEN